MKRQRRKRVPQRSCVACGAQGAKRELLRVVRTPQGAVAYDPTHKAPGRGAYVCRDKRCVEKAMRSRALSRSLKAPVAPDVLRVVAEAIDE
ncbi:MAG: YlxR family protein [Armatimonadota bacterium]